MNKEVKEILEELKDASLEEYINGEIDYDYYIHGDKAKKLLNYITNLEKKCEILEVNNNLLIKQKTQMYEDLDKAHRTIDDDRKFYKGRIAEWLDYRTRIEKAIDKIQYIIDYGFDYDGFNKSEDLKGLIDMLVDYARQSIDILKGEDK